MGLLVFFIDMIKELCSKSSILFLFLNGKIEDILAPWYICVDFQLETITVKKRNWYLIGINENVHAFKFIRNIDIHQRIFGADVEIKSFGCSSKVFCIAKKEADKLKDALIEYNQRRKIGFVIS